MNVAKELHDCMDAGYSMYVWWYITRYYGPIEEDGTATKTGYVMAHFARWVRPGFNKISCTASPASNIYTTAYKNGSNLVLVAVNLNSSASSVTFNLSGMTVSGFTTYTTTSSSNLASGSVSVSGSNFSVSLPGSSITTLVSGGGSPGTPDPTTPPGQTPDPTAPPVITPDPTPGPTDIPIDCTNAPEWDPDAVYENAGTRVVYNGNLYENNWYSSGQNPEENSGEYEVWTLIGSCDPQMTPSPTTVPIPSPADTSAPTATPAPNVTLGDVNSDGTIDIVDALLIAQYYVGLNPSPFNPAAADTNCDGNTDIVDALLTAQYYVGLVTGFC